MNKPNVYYNPATGEVMDATGCFYACIFCERFDGALILSCRGITLLPTDDLRSMPCFWGWN